EKWRGALAWGGGQDEIAKGDAGEIAAAGARERAAGLLDHGAALLDIEQGRLAGMGADREHEPIGEPGGLAHEVEMAVGDGIERSRKKRGPRHGGGLARAIGSRKVVPAAIGAGGRERAGTIRGGAGPGRTVYQLLLSFRFLRLLLNQNCEPLPSRGRSVACPILAPGSWPSGSHD